MFSVVIPLYNKELSVKNTINSVLSQSFKEFEIIIVNDGSTDKSFEIVKKIEDPRIILIDKSNGGVSSARNKGIQEAKHEWIVLLDADDLWKENHLEVLSDLITTYPKDKVFCTSYIRSNEVEQNNGENDVNVIEDYFLKAHTGFFCSSVACIHNSVFKDVGNFNTNLNRGEDLELWTRIGRKYRFIQANQVTATYRVDAENRSDNNLKLKYTRIYNYNFNSCESENEYLYYKKAIVLNLRNFIKKMKIISFFKLYIKHSKHINFLEIFN